MDYEYYCTFCGNMFSTVHGCRCPNCASEETVIGDWNENMSQEEIDEEVKKIEEAK